MKFVSRLLCGAFVFVVIAHPILGTVWIFVAAFGGEVQEIVGRVHQVNAAGISGVGALNVSVLVAVKCAYTLTFVHVHAQRGEIVNCLATLDLLWGEGDVEIKIKIGLER